MCYQRSPCEIREGGAGTECTNWIVKASEGEENLSPSFFLSEEPRTKEGGGAVERAGAGIIRRVVNRAGVRGAVDVKKWTLNSKQTMNGSGQ